jgi:hypothetical protein
VTGAFTGTLQAPLSVCNQSHPLPDNQSTIDVSATGQLDGHRAQVVIIDPAGAPDYESQGHALFTLYLSATSWYGWTQNPNPDDPSAPPVGIKSFNANTGATFSVSLIPNQQFSSGISNSQSAQGVTVDGTIRCP